MYIVCGFHEQPEHTSAAFYSLRLLTSMYTLRACLPGAKTLPSYLQVEFDKPEMTVDALIGYGRLLVDEQENVQRVQLAEAYLSGAELAGIDGTSMPPELVKKIEKRQEEDVKKQEKAGPSLLG